MAGDVGGHTRCAARSPFGQRHAPSFGVRRAHHEPRPPVRLDEVVVADPASPIDPGVGSVIVDPRVDQRPIGAVADEFDGELRNGAPSLGQRGQGETLTLHRGQPSDHDDVRVVGPAGSDRA